jgi:hypothetical protein
MTNVAPENMPEPVAVAVVVTAESPRRAPPIPVEPQLREGRLAKHTRTHTHRDQVRRMHRFVRSALHKAAMAGAPPRVTAVCSQARNVLSLAKYVLGSIFIGILRGMRPSSPPHVVPHVKHAATLAQHPALAPLPLPEPLRLSACSEFDLDSVLPPCIGRSELRGKSATLSI